MCRFLCVIYVLIWVTGVLASDSCDSMAVKIKNGTVYFPSLPEICSECIRISSSVSEPSSCDISPLYISGRGLTLRLEELCGCLSSLPLLITKSTTNEKNTFSTGLINIESTITTDKSVTTNATTTDIHSFSYLGSTTTETNIEDPSTIDTFVASNATTIDIYVTRTSYRDSYTTDISTAWANTTDTSNVSISTTTDIHVPTYLNPNTTETSNTEPATTDTSSDTTSTTTVIDTILYSSPFTAKGRIVERTTTENPVTSNETTINIYAFSYPGPTTTKTSVEDPSTTDTFVASNATTIDIYVTRTSHRDSYITDISTAWANTTGTSNVSISTTTDMHVPTYLDPNTTETNKTEPATTNTSSDKTSTTKAIDAIWYSSPFTTKDGTTTENPVTSNGTTINIHAFSYPGPTSTETSVEDPSTTDKFIVSKAASIDTYVSRSSYTTGISTVRANITKTSNVSISTTTDTNVPTHLKPTATDTGEIEPATSHISRATNLNPGSATTEINIVESNSTDAIASNSNSSPRISITESATTEARIIYEFIITTGPNATSTLSPSNTAANAKQTENNTSKTLVSILVALLLVAALVILTIYLICRQNKRGSYDVHNSPIPNKEIAPVMAESNF